MTQRNVWAASMRFAKAAERRFPSIRTPALFRDPLFHVFAPKLRMPTALRNRTNVDDRLDRGFANEPREFICSRSSMSERE